MTDLGKVLVYHLLLYYHYLYTEALGHEILDICGLMEQRIERLEREVSDLRTRIGAEAGKAGVAE